MPLFASLSSAQNTDILKQQFGNDTDWYRDKVPTFECSDQLLTDVYYYRWKIFRAHQRNLGSNGYISTEFLDDVSWQNGPWASINDASIFHLNEGRWCRDPRYKQDYAMFMYSKNSNPRQYSEAMAAGVWNNYLVDGDPGLSLSLLQSMQNNYEGWIKERFDQSKGLFWISPQQDATEYSIASIDASGGKDGLFGGEAFRPTINSYQIANARAIANIAKLKGDQAVVDKYTNRADALKKLLQDNIWNSTLSHFIDRYYANNTFVKYWTPIRGRELAGMVPWAHDVPDDNEEYSKAWGHILDSELLAGQYGLRTVEPSYQHYMHVYRYVGNHAECHWNGPSWPYQTTQVLTGMANVLDHYPTTSQAVSVQNYISLLKQYATQHYNKNSGTLDLQEDYNPDTGYPIVGLDRSHHYFHSGYIDLIMGGLVGIRPRQDDVLEVNPLIDTEQISYFRAENILYHGRNVTVQWDKTGDKYGQIGLRIQVDGQDAGSSDTLERLKVNVERQTVPVGRPIAKSIQLQANSASPKVGCSIANTDQQRLHDVFDGRIWFWPEVAAANGFDTPQGNSSEQWVSIDLGSVQQAQRAEIAFYQNAAQGFDVPGSYRVQINDGSWKDISGAVYGTPVANGVSKASWSSTSARNWRILVKPQNGSRVRLVEFTLF
ncbi:hypothetical protein FANTH_6849 [Fusarium anthophilum]|uniref:Mannosylglycerate hydrolase MGH1-like glycoside hydrolase domain-containing protein n=1 Tax=Fusarium anthophilum TaxID=48485 RepID=A0A8H4ZGR5_9HYPO|nr:hypothetical protein FANTH_6849 [Fusarium anthophilum]